MTKPLKIIHLEDSQIDAELVQEMLSVDNIEAEITRVDNRDDFLEAVKDPSVDIILADYSLPSFDGLSALKLTQDMKLDKPFILVSAVLGEELAIESLKSGATDYVLKARLQRLGPAIKRALREVAERDQRKRLELAISEMEELYFKLAERVRGFLKMELPSGKYVTVDPFLEDVSGYPINDWKNTPYFIQTIVHPDDKVYYEEKMAEMRQGTVPKMMEYRVLKKDGSQRWWLQFNIGAYDIDKRLVSVTMVLIDNTENKESQLKYQNLFENALVGMYRTDIKTGNFIEANEGMAVIFGYDSQEDFKQSSALEHYATEEERDNFLEILREHEVVRGLELELLKKDRTKVWVNLSARLYPKEGYIEGVMIDISDKKQAQQELFQREQELEKIFENTGSATILVNTEGLIIKCNNRLFELTGFSKDEIVNKMIFTELVHEDDREKMMAYHKQRRNPDEPAPPTNYDFKIRHKDGRIISCNLLVGLIPGTDLSVASVIDISKQKEAQEAIRESEERYRTLVETSPFGIILASLDNKILFANKQAIQLYGASIEEEVVGENFFDFIKEESIPSFQKLIEEFKKTGTFSNVELNLERKDGTSFIAEISSSMVRDKNGEPVSTISIIQDITQRRENERSRRLLANIVENSKEVVICGDEKGSIFYASASVKEVFGWNPKELQGKHMSILAPPGGEQTQKNLFNTIFSGKENSMTFETVRRHKDGSLIPVIMTVTAIDDEETNSRSVSAIIVDLRDMKRLEDSLRNRSYELEVLNMVITAGYKSKTMIELLDFILNAVLNSLDFRGGAIYFVNDERTHSNIKRHLGLTSSFVKETESLSIKGSPFKKVFQNGKTVTLENYSEMSPGHESFGIESLLAVPFFSKQKVIGALVVTTREKRTLSKDLILTLEAIGREIGTAIAKMKLEEEKIAREKDTQELFDVLDEIYLTVDNETGQLIQLNKQLETTTGYTRKELLRLSFKDLLSSSEKEQIDSSEFLKRIITESTKTASLFLKTKDGKTIPIQAKFKLASLSTGQRIVILATVIS